MPCFVIPTLIELCLLFIGLMQKSDWNINFLPVTGFVFVLTFGLFSYYGCLVFFVLVVVRKSPLAQPQPKL
jgi:hypothetical protein